MFNIKHESHNDSRLYHDLPTLGYATVHAPETWVFLEPHLSSPRQSQYTHGEPLRVLRQLGDFVYTQSLRDDYCGWVQQSALCFATREPIHATHRTIQIAPVTLKASLKSPILLSLPQDSLLSPTDWHEDYAHIPELGWIDRRHLETIDTITPIEQSALEQLNRSYVWGGRGIAGLDCSALAQWCYRRAGFTIPRDSDLQRLYLQTHHQTIEQSAVQAGDLLFTPGHVMVAISNTELVHASGHHMRVVRESIHETITRIQSQNNQNFYLHICRLLKN